MPTRRLSIAARLNRAMETKNAEIWSVVAIAFLFCVVFGAFSVLRHRTYHSFGDDLGVFDQIFWNTTQGRPFESTISLGISQPHFFFGDHFSPIYWVIMPIYALFPRPETLVIIQTIAISAGVVPIYLLARSKLEPGLIRLSWVLAYFLFLPVAFIALFDFHETTLAILPLGFAIYFVETGRHRWFILSLLVAFLVKEEMPLIGIGIGAYIILKRDAPLLGIGVVLVSAAVFATIVGAIIPSFAQGRSYAYVGYRYSALGTTWRQIFVSLLTKPVTVGKVLLQAKKAAFLVGIFGPVLGLSALSGWAALMLLPTLGYLLLSNYEPQYSFTLQYAAPLVPLVLATSIIGLARLSRPAQSRVALAVVISSILFSVVVGDMPFSRRFDFNNFRVEARYEQFERVLAMIPPSASVSAENNLTPHLTHRRYVYTLEYQGTQRADYVALDYAAVQRDQNKFQAQVNSIQAQGYRVVGSGEGLALLKRYASP